jgi:hypothetical protein
MGTKLTKNKNVSTSEKIKEQRKVLSTIAEDTTNHVDITTNEENKQNDKNKKKKAQKLNKKSSETRVDKSTNTENCVLPSSSFTEQLVGGEASTVNNNVLLDTSIAQINAAYQPETLNQDVQELRDACVRNDNLSAEINVSNNHILNEQEYQANNPNIYDGYKNDTSITVVTNGDLVHGDEQQQNVES